MKRASLAVLTLLLLCCCLGCGPRDPRTYPVTGKVVFKGGNIDQLRGWVVQFQPVDQPDARAIAEIGAGGAFKAVSIVNNHGKEGVLEGEHRMCVVNVLAPEAKLIGQKFKSYETSGLTVTVPLKEELIVEVSK